MNEQRGIDGMKRATGKTLDLRQSAQPTSKSPAPILKVPPAPDLRAAARQAAMRDSFRYGIAVTDVARRTQPRAVLPPVTPPVSPVVAVPKPRPRRPLVPHRTAVAPAPSPKKPSRFVVPLSVSTRLDRIRVPRSGLSGRMWRIVQYPLIAAIALGAAYTTAFGQWIIVAYGLYALIRRLDSRYSFGAALFVLITVPVFSAIGQSGIAANAAVYVYELLVIGTVQAILELRRSSKLTS